MSPDLVEALLASGEAVMRVLRHGFPSYAPDDAYILVGAYRLEAHWIRHYDAVVRQVISELEKEKTNG